MSGSRDEEKSIPFIQSGIGGVVRKMRIHDLPHRIAIMYRRASGDGKIGFTMIVEDLAVERVERG